MQDRLEACRTQAGEGVAVGDLDVLAALQQAGGQSLKEPFETGTIKIKKSEDRSQIICPLFPVFCLLLWRVWLKGYAQSLTE